MTRRRTSSLAAMGVLVLTLFAVDGRTARADSYVIAVPGSVAAGYATPVMVHPKGTKALFLNLDVAVHDVRGRTAAFSSALTPTGRSKVIQGANKLKAGNYAFYCTLHPNMTGTLIVV